MQSVPLAIAVRSSRSPARSSRAAYAGRALAHPLTVMAIVGGFGLGMWIGSVVATVALIATLAAAAWTVSSCDFFRHAADQHRARQAKLSRRERRHRELDANGVGRDGLLELTVLCDEIERCDPGLARRYDLEELLDRHVALTISVERCLRATRAIDRAQLARTLDQPAEVGGRRARLLQRRLRYWDQCRRDAERCGEELDATVELVRLLAQKAACPEIRLDADVLDRRLDDLEEEDRALEQLAKGA